MFDAEKYYDAYWVERDTARTEARSRERAAIALWILGDAENRTLLEVGCGPGWTLESFMRAGFRSRGVDVSSRAVEAARSRGLDVERADIETDDLTAVAADRADVVVALEVLEHLLDPLGALTKMGALLAPGGQLVVSLPNEITLPARLRILCGRLPFGGHTDAHVRHFDRSSAASLFAAAGLRVVDEVPVSVFPPRWSFVRSIASPFVRWLPGAFAIAGIYRLERGAE